MNVALWRILHVKRADLLIAETALGGVLLTWLVITGLATFVQFANQVGDIGHHGYSLAKAIAYVLLTIPSRAYRFFVFAAVIGGLTGLGSLSASGELTALRAAGMSRLRISLSVVGLIGVLSIGVFVLGETAAPAGDQRAEAIQLQRSAGHLWMGHGIGLWARDGTNMINAKATLARIVHGQPEVELADVRIFGFNDAGALTSFRHARRATEQGQTWVLHDVRDSRVSSSGIATSTLKQQVWQTSLDPRVLEDSVRHVDHLPLRDLSRNIAWLRANGQNPGVYLNAYWARAFYPVDTLLLVLFASPFAYGFLRSGGLGKRLFVGVIVAIAWYFLQGALIGTGTVSGLAPLWANAIPPALLAGGATWYFRRA